MLLLMHSDPCKCCLLDNEADEESYDELRKAVTENWVTMKEYYKAVSFCSIKALLELNNFLVQL